MALLRIDDDLPEDWKNLRVNRILGGKLYYVRDGRNAWHSTWVSRWYLHSFHFTFEGAKVFAEKKRVQGSVFQIHEVPTLVLEVSKGYALVTELFTQSPLSQYTLAFFQRELAERVKSVPFDWRHDVRMAPNFVQAQLARNPTRFHPRLHHKLQLVMDSFRQQSLFWQPVKPDRAIVRLLGTEQDGQVCQLKRDGPMRTWKSCSFGGQYPLSWQEERRANHANGIREILSHARMYKPPAMNE